MSKIVFIRHTTRRKEVDEHDVFMAGSPAARWSPPFEAMNGSARQRFRPDDWNIYWPRRRDGDNSYSDGAATARLIRDAIIPVCQYFAYLEVGEAVRA